MTRTADNAKIHIRLITAMVNKLMSENYKVSADHIGYPNGKPDEFMGQIPDIYAEKGDEKLFIEAETCDSLKDPKTKVQWVALSSSDEIDFFVIIPKECLGEARQLAKKWDVKVKTFWTMEI